MTSAAAVLEGRSAPDGNDRQEQRQRSAKMLSKSHATGLAAVVKISYAPPAHERD
jgi:hypothetical protein